MLMLIQKCEGINQNEIARKLSVRAATVAIMLRRMEKAGLIERRQDEKDKRIQHVFLTEKGRKICELLKEQAERIEKMVTEGLSENEKEELARLLDHVIANFRRSAKGCYHD